MFGLLAIVQGLIRKQVVSAVTEVDQSTFLVWYSFS